jgi:2-polyprenyl-6-hydroxyphenyl methylase/3-demethylubiquinone-9 3-methyltransferase
MKFSRVMHNPKILEIGAAQGSLLIALTRLGYDCEGIEPGAEALQIAQQMKVELATNIKISKGYAEHLAYHDNQFEYVIAISVLEHVNDPQAVMAEVFRILKPGGIFYFSTTSCLCPWQGEIRYLPCFSWYPNRLKRWIMKYAQSHLPSLIGYTDTPALNWFTPMGTEKMLKRAGFQEIYDTWDVVLSPDSPYLKKSWVRFALRLIKLNKLTRRIADIFSPAGVQAIAIKSDDRVTNL